MGQSFESPSSRPSPAEGEGAIGSHMSEFQEEQTVDSRVVFEGRRTKLRVDTVQMPSGRLTTREIVDGSDSVCIVPLDRRGNV